MKLSIIGAGYVGLVTGACLADIGHDVIILDIDRAKIDKLQKGIVPIFEPSLDRLINKNMDKLSFTTHLDEVVREADIHFICVWTPTMEDGSADISAVRSVARELGKNFNKFKVKAPIIVTKSTVPVGTGKAIRQIVRKEYKNDFAVCSNPEFLREGQAIADMMHPDRIVIGSSDEESAKKVASLYKDLRAPIIITDIPTAEMIKYAANAFLATKISFINEVANVCDVVGADVEAVADAIGMDNRIGKSFLKPGMGYGGSCFPKDVRALKQFSNTNGYDFKLLKSVIEVNEQQRELVIEKLIRATGPLKGKNIFVLGLAFKAHTDDVRESGAIDLVQRLQKQGALVRVHDPLALLNAKKVLDDKVKLVGQPHEGANGAHAIIIATEWPEFKDLDWEIIKKQMTEPIIIDGRNLLDPSKMRELGFLYEGIGRR
ncbi:MAG: UDP-glucose 6-dehydrogenase [Parcubacteria group bacterium CG_4_9_14_0_2_um_filter_41_8]|nr:MAG: UDP-glucose 6-dehydrogenase [Parcubacteria group bacterium CG22_combo_CG10-13_8_21_14_all_41_9]PIR56915.1 MAG: UDP-glucose 6-dehydrogenase [Parcubacteria group bacterium CG10_big_fil_rev_8_21_14_0_10_41_35]PJC40860.1 MAG: UDP-glucose 6-dehydrogenase [Parcubacteria group bacterium CG_4_9_14_0_2_um_filter_41_8]